MIDTETSQTVLYGFGMMSIGFWFGNQFTGRLASQHANSIDLSTQLVSTQPEWIATVQQANQIALVAFAGFMVALVVLDYYAGVANAAEEVTQNE